MFLFSLLLGQLLQYCLFQVLNFLLDFQNLCLFRCSALAALLYSGSRSTEWDNLCLFFKLLIRIDLGCSLEGIILWFRVGLHVLILQLLEFASFEQVLLRRHGETSEAWSPLLLPLLVLLLDEIDRWTSMSFKILESALRRARSLSSGLLLIAHFPLLKNLHTVLVARGKRGYLL